MPEESDFRLEFRRLPDNYTLKDFCCGNKKYDEFITTSEAFEHQRDKLGVTYLFYEVGKDQCVGYVTLATGDLNKTMHEKLETITPHGNVPGLLLAQMACDKRYQKRHLGTALVRWAIGKAYSLSSDVGCRLIFLECEDNNVAFYTKNKFELIPPSKRKRNIMFIDLLDGLCLKCGFVNSRDKEVCDKCGSKLKP